MARRKLENKSKSDETTTGHLDSIKAAAHVWFEHGSPSSSGSKLINSFDTSSINNVPSRSSQPQPPAYKPSRFKLEATASSTVTTTPIHGGRGGGHINMHSLLDEYEVDRIIHDLKEFNDLSSRRHAKMMVCDLVGNEMIKKKDKEVSKKTGISWIKRGFACSTNASDVVVSTRRKSTSSLNFPRKSNIADCM